MIKTKITCPWCVPTKMMSLSGSTVHVRSKHPDKVEEFKNMLPELKKIGITTGVKKVPDKIEEPKVVEEKPKEVKPEVPEETKITIKPEVFTPPTEAGDKKPAKGKNFLDSFCDWLDSEKF